MAEVKKGSHPDYPGISCKDILDNSNIHENGEYWIDPEGKGKSFKVYCDMTTDGGKFLVKSFKDSIYNGVFFKAYFP